MDRIVKMFMLATLVVGFLMTQCGAEEMEVPGSVAQDSAIPKTSSGNFHEWKSAQQYTYALNLQNTTATSSGETLMEIALEGNLKMVPFDVEGGGTKIYFELEQHKVDTRDESQASDMETLEKELAAPGYFVLKNNRLVKMGLAKDSSAMAMGLLRALAALFQMDSGPRDAASWEALEYDAAGAHQVAYKSEHPSLLTKRKLRYQTGLSGAAGMKGLFAAPKPEIVKSEMVYEIESGRIKKITTDETIELAVTADQTLATATQISLEFMALSKKEVAVDRQALKAQTDTIDATKPYRKPLSPDAMDQQRLAGKQFKDVMAGLATLAGDNRADNLKQKSDEKPKTGKEKKEAEAWMGDWSGLFSALPAFFRQQPKTIEVARKEIEQGSPAGESLMGGLSAAGTEAAQAALIKLVRNTDLDEELRGSAATSLIRTNTPKPNTVVFLKELMEDPQFQIHGLYGLGTVARKLREQGDEEQSKNIAALLTDRLEKAVSTQDKVQILRGIANSAHPWAFDQVAPLLQSEVPTLRVGTLEAIRRMPRPEVDALIAATLDGKKESATTVRRVAASSAGFREPTEVLITALAKSSLEDPDAHVRYECVSVLTNWLENKPSITPVLQKVTQTESEPKIKNLAEQALKKEGSVE